MEIAGKTLRRRVLTTLALFVALVVFDYVTASAIDWTINLLVPVLFFLFSLTTDFALKRWLNGRE